MAMRPGGPSEGPRRPGCLACPRQRCRWPAGGRRGKWPRSETFVAERRVNAGEGVREVPDLDLIALAEGDKARPVGREEDPLVASDGRVVDFVPELEDHPAAVGLDHGHEPPPAVGREAVPIGAEGDCGGDAGQRQRGEAGRARCEVVEGQTADLGLAGPVSKATPTRVPVGESAASRTLPSTGSPGPAATPVATSWTRTWPSVEGPSEHLEPRRHGFPTVGAENGEIGRGGPGSCDRRGCRPVASRRAPVRRPARSRGSGCRD